MALYSKIKMPKLTNYQRVCKYCSQTFRANGRFCRVCDKCKSKLKKGGINPKVNRTKCKYCNEKFRLNRSLKEHEIKCRRER